jgi:hypothetical protein
MLFKKTVTPATLDLIAKLVRDPLLQDFYLVGGTALSLKIGHRKSIDIDLFTVSEFDGRKMARYLKKQYHAQLTVQGKNCVKGQINGVEFDFVSHRYPHVKPPETIEGIRMMSLEDIAAMKINAIVGSGKRIKDFVDIHYLLKKMDYRDMVKYYCAKYPNVSSEMAKASLLYHKDIDFNVPVIIYDTKLKWEDVEKGIRKAIADHDQVLSKNRVDLPKVKPSYLNPKKGKSEDFDEDLDQGLGL